MSCEHNTTIIDCSCEICTICGLVLKNSILTTETSRHHPWSEPIGNKVYSHKSRFRKLLLRLLMSSSSPPAKVYDFLKTKKITNIDNIRQHLKNYPQNSKYYEFTSFFAYHFLKYKWEPVDPDDIKNIFFFVDNISFWGKQHLQRSHFPFPYFFVLRKVFADRHDILPLINSLKCKRRIAKYENLWTELSKECVRPKLRKTI